jgi:creatinine amidohydrolase
MTDTVEVRLDHMRPHQIRECREKADIAFLPLGALEWHGLHNAVGLDAVKAHHICCEVARKLGGGAVFPSLVWGLPRDSFFVDTINDEITSQVAAAYGTEAATVKGYSPHGGMDVQEQWLFYQRLLRMSFEHIASFGFRSIYILAGHMPLVNFGKPAAVAFSRSRQMAGHPVTIDWGGEGDAAGLRADHAGRWETSLMLALEPNSVDMGQLEQHPDYVGVGSNPNAIEANRAQGEEWVDACTTAIAAEVRWLVDNYPQLPTRHGHLR